MQILKKITAAVLLACLGMGLASCKAVSKGLKMIDDSENERFSKILTEKAADYGIDADSCEVMQGGQYYKVLVGTPDTLDKLKDLAILHRKWQRFCYGECKGREFSVTFYDKEHPEIYYGGFSDQDHGYNAELYFSDYYIYMKFVDQIHLWTLPDKNGNKKSKVTPEEFTEKTGISSETSEEYRKWFHEQFPSRKYERPDPAEHDITFIPGDTINHREKFFIGDEKCPISEGTYTIDIYDKHGIIHITDSEGNVKYRFDGDYREGHTDALYEYTALPAKITLAEGDIFYTTNCASSLDRVTE